MRINAMNRTLLLIITTIAIIACGCTRQQPSDPRLQRLTLSVDTGPQAAIDSLAAIDPATLGDYDRHYYNFLTVKARDKAYIVHTSDSLILDVINHFGRSPKMAEALYYAGRVYSDLGDYPTALRYFHDALDRISDDPEEDELRGRVLSQTGRMLSNCGLHRQSLPYLKECLELSISRNDTVNTTYDYQLLGSIYLDLQEYDTATIYLDKAYSLAKHLSDSDLAFMEGFLAIASYQQNKIDSALIMIRNVPERIFDDDKDFFLVYASNIYFKAEKFDTAYMYAKQAINSPKSDFQISAYCALLNPELRKYSSPDTIFEYLERYRMAIRQMHRQIDEKSITVQNAQYNYSVHERRSTQLRKLNQKLFLWITLCVLVIIFVIALYIKRNHALLAKKIELQHALSVIRLLNSQLEDNTAKSTHQSIETESIINNTENNANSVHNSYTQTETPPRGHKLSAKQIQQQIKAEITQLKCHASKADNNQKDLHETDAYQTILFYLHDKKILKDTDQVWDSIMNTIHNTSPNFKSTLCRLSCNKLTSDDYKLAALLKMGFTSSQIAILIGKSKSTIINRRKSLCSKVFYDIVDTSELNQMINII